MHSFPAALSRIKLFVKREVILAISSTSCKGKRLTNRPNEEHQRNKQQLESPRQPFPPTCMIRDPLPKTIETEVGPENLCRNYLRHHHRSSCNWIRIKLLMVLEEQQCFGLFGADLSLKKPLS